MDSRLQPESSPRNFFPSVPVTLDATCSVCGCQQQTDFFEVRNAPVHVGIVWDSAEQARHAPTGDILLSYCHGCGFVHNRIFAPEKLSYRPGYEASLVHSEVFVAFLKSVAERLIERFELHNKTVMEIGSGAGHFVRLLCELGGNDGIGIDPTVQTEETQPIGSHQLRSIRDFFSDASVDLPADFVCCLSVLEHIPNPAQTIRTVRRLAERREAGVYFEVFNAFNAIRKCETWSVHYEQCNYFSLASFRNLFERCGLRVLDAAECYEGGQYLYVDAVADAAAGTRHPSSVVEARQDERLPNELTAFARTHSEKLATWRDRLQQFQATGKRVVVWGTGGKGISFLNALDTAELIPYVLEINPLRQGKYVPGSAQKIVPPTFLAEYRPDVVIITNALYEREMKHQAAEMGVQCEFLIA